MTTERIIGKYRLVEELASGAFGRVYRAEDISQNNRIVALKVMHAAHLDSAQDRERFLQEAQFLKVLEHPYILPILDADIDDGFPFLVTEYAPHGSLLDRLKKQAPHPLSLQETLNVLLQIGQALSYAHQQNIIHRDLKPANILFDANGTALLADFGIATVLASSMRSGSAAGTPAYMAPEQFRGVVSKEGDQYALGCIAYELLTGSVPFNAPDFFSLGYKHMSENPVRPSQLNLLVPPSVEDAILTAMAKERNDRHVSVDAFLYALGVLSSFTSRVITSSTPAAPTFGATLKPSPQLGMPDSAMEWANLLSSDERVKRGGSGGTGAVQPPLYNDAYEASRVAAFDNAPENAGHWRLEEVTGKQPIVTLSSSGSVASRNSLSGDALALQESAAEGMVGNREYATLPASPFNLQGFNTLASPFDSQDSSIPQFVSAAPVPGWASTTNAPGSFDSFEPTSTPAKKRYRLNTARGLIMIASLVAVLLILLSGSIYVLLKTPYPQSIATAIKTHDITKLLPPTTQPTTRPTAKPTANPTKASSPVVQVVVNSGPTPGGSGSSITPTPQPFTATVTITPATTTASQQFGVNAVLGTPSAGQVQARQLTPTSSQNFTATSTGQGITPATPATGVVTLSSASTTAILVPTGTTITDITGTISFVTLQDVTIPALATGQTSSTANVNVQAQTAGASGNIAALAINEACCTTIAAGITATNGSAFTGGQDATTYTFLQQSDIDTADAPVISALKISVSSSLSSLVHSNEKTVGNPICTPTVTTVSPVNSQVASTAGTVSETCTQEVYDAQGAEKDAATLLTQQESNGSYTLTSQVTTGIASATVVDNLGTVAIAVNTSATARYVFTTAHCQQIAGMIAGKSLSQVQSMLKATTGVASVVINITGSNNGVLPTVVSRITVTAP